MPSEANDIAIGEHLLNTNTFTYAIQTSFSVLYSDIYFVLSSPLLPI